MVVLDINMLLVIIFEKEMNPNNFSDRRDESHDKESRRNCWVLIGSKFAVKDAVASTPPVLNP